MYSILGRITILMSVLWLAAGCSRVRVALYDRDTREDYAREALAASPAARDAQLRQGMVATAEKYTGTRYKYASTDPKKGFDCSGLVHFAGSKQGLQLARSSRALATAGERIPWKKARVGDLVFFGASGRIDHVAIVKKNDASGLWVVHATTQRGVISENILASSYWKKRLLHAVDLSSLR